MASDTLHSVLVDQARRAPRRVAAGFRGQTLSYGQLLQISRQIAVELKAAGVEPGHRIAIGFPKGLESIASVYAGSLLGAAYVPIDIRWPDARKAAVIEAAAPTALLCRTQDREHLARQLNDHISLLSFEDCTQLNGPEAPLPPTTSRDSESTAYILYTSGTTGIPKGVAHSHASALNFARWAVEQLGVTCEDRLAGHAPLCFDLSTFDLFAALCAGASVWPVAEALMFRGELMRRFIVEQRISTWYSVPRAWSLIADSAQAKPLGALRHVILAGERIIPTSLPKSQQAAPSATFHNWFGPTETNVCCAYTLTPGDLEGNTEIPIGTAAAGASLRLRPCPDEMDTSVLWVTGPSLMSGYLNGPPRADWYETGDIVRQDKGGQLVFVGRRDRQLKVRGHRIEALEVERLVDLVDGVKESIALIHNDELIIVVTYCPLGEQGNLVESAIRSQLRTNLPSACQPNAVVLVDEIPRNPNGKRDLARLEVILSESC